MSDYMPPSQRLISLTYTDLSLDSITSFQAQMFHSAQPSTSAKHSHPVRQIRLFGNYRSIESIDIAPPIEIDPTIWYTQSQENDDE
jgi:hypothetical protein